MIKASENQVRVLAYLRDLPRGRTTAHVFNRICGNPRFVRSLFARGWVVGDEIPARYVVITDRGRSQLTSAADHPAPAAQGE